MLSRYEFIQQSLETHLFFARIMKEHAFFLMAGFVPKDSKFIDRAAELKKAFEEFLSDVIVVSNGVVSEEFLQSGQVVTQFTLEAEKTSGLYTGIAIPTEITKAETQIAPNMGRFEPALERRVYMLNRRAITLTGDIIQFKSAVLNEVLCCKLFTVNYPLLIDHILREARLYQCFIIKLQGREVINVQREFFEQEEFWNRIMAEHAKFIRGLLDPCEEELIKTANQFGNEFDQLTAQAKEAMDRTIPNDVTEESLQAVKGIRNFKAQATEGLLDCKIRSIILPLLGDHTLREANHYLRLLQIYKRG